MGSFCRWMACALACFGGTSTPAWTAEPAKPQRPKLAVLVVFDQMRGDYVTRWQALFGKDGFQRLASEGAWFQNCDYPYADTVTAAGHASMLTGTTPHHHGIIANDWYDRASHARVTSVSSTRYDRLTGASTQNKSHGSSPERLLAPTVGDVLKEATGNRARVIGLSLKDRSAILTAGRHADACYWWDTRTGNFISSTYYFKQLPNGWSLSTAPIASIAGSARTGSTCGLSWITTTTADRMTWPPKAAAPVRVVSSPIRFRPSQARSTTRRSTIRRRATTCSSILPPMRSTPRSWASATCPMCCVSAFQATIPSATVGAPIRRKSWT